MQGIHCANFSPFSPISRFKIQALGASPTLVSTRSVSLGFPSISTPVSESDVVKLPASLALSTSASSQSVQVNRETDHSVTAKWRNVSQANRIVVIEGTPVFEQPRLPAAGMRSSHSLMLDSSVAHAASNSSSVVKYSAFVLPVPETFPAMAYHQLQAITNIWEVPHRKCLTTSQCNNTMHIACTVVSQTMKHTCAVTSSKDALLDPLGLTYSRWGDLRSCMHKTKASCMSWWAVPQSLFNVVAIR